ncbi:DUF2809 domain-containing protein [Siphonobacter sp. SORGH_AS_0500]|uniref:ribosomal maturation YjgA family protein n=1 Tax=Siphonobacter sp. SORGH_AS_0500 TaxID=1864824 RepID=UPI00285F8757|nr:DUF2809 domain-containing protein [Siphonobacter sp. SORGH_AS_0500]MDR6195521.1 hypothetical protein [Siphonobacter sp. SORGH_AS_0500]
MISKARLRYGFLILVTIAIGLISRKLSFIPLGVGDALWALMIFWMMIFCFPTAKLVRLMLVSLLICFAVEASQLYQAEWINAIRRTLPGRLILGQGFLWSDLWAYAIGVSAGGFVQEKVINKTAE